MKAVNKHTGAAIVRTVETVLATCRVDPHSFERGSDGAIKVQDDGSGAEVHWDSMDAATEDGEELFQDADGNHVKASEIELQPVDVVGDEDGHMPDEDPNNPCGKSPRIRQGR